MAEDLKDPVLNEGKISFYSDGEKYQFYTDDIFSDGSRGGAVSLLSQNNIRCCFTEKYLKATLQKAKANKVHY